MRSIPTLPKTLSKQRSGITERACAFKSRDGCSQAAKMARSYHDLIKHGSKEKSSAKLGVHGLFKVLSCRVRV